MIPETLGKLEKFYEYEIVADILKMEWSKSDREGDTIIWHRLSAESKKK